MLACGYKCTPCNLNLYFWAAHNLEQAQILCKSEQLIFFPSEWVSFITSINQPSSIFDLTIFTSQTNIYILVGHPEPEKNMWN